VIFGCIECSLRCSYIRYTNTYKDIPPTELLPFVDLFKLSTEKKNVTRNNWVDALYHLL
jgi:hypothetical protein